MTRLSVFARRIVRLSMGASLVTFGGNAAMSQEAANITVADVGFATPESVLHDTTADVYLVSNINGTPLDKDGNGFISRVSPDGEVLDLKWIDGADAGTTLNAPKGMAISGGQLYVTDIDCIRMFNQATGAPAGEVCVDGASFLNDVTPAQGGGVLFTDTGLDANFAPAGTDAVYRLDSNGVTTLIANAELGAPNGILDTDEGPLVVTFGSGEVYRLSDGSREVIAESSGRQLDGIVEMADGSILTSSWGDSCIHEMEPDGEMTCIISDVEAPADIGADIDRSRVLIPLFNSNSLLFHSVF
jgi:sugar lactone lactonase YvrE